MEIDHQVKEHFLQTVTRNEDGLNEISLLRAEDKLSSFDNLYIAKKKLITGSNKLLVNNLYEKYVALLEWLSDKIIEEVPECEKSFYGH